MDRQLAAEVMDQLLAFSAPFNVLTEISLRLPVEEGQQMRRLLGSAMLDIIELMRPIIQEYPDLDPDKES